MANPIFHITLASGSVLVSGPIYAFIHTGPGTLDVAADGFLINSGGGSADGALLAGSGWIVKVAGTIVGAEHAGITHDNDAIVTVASTGLVYGGLFGIHSLGKLTLTNNGRVGSASLAVSAGLLDDTVINNGVITGGLNLGNGTNSITNTGAITGTITLGSGFDTIKNSGRITGAIGFGTGPAKLNNSGAIDGDVTANDAATVVNTGRMTKLSCLADSNVTNRGQLATLIVDGSGTVVNSGHIQSVIFTFGGVQFTNYEMKGNVMVSGVVDNVINLGKGSDGLFGGANAEVVRDNSGADTYLLGGGNDTFLATNFNAIVFGDGDDIVNGGGGIDLYDASDAPQNVFINLDGIFHDHAGASTLPFDVAANTAFGTNISGDTDPNAPNFNSDSVFGFENVTGGAGSDWIWGNSGNNVLSGGDARDNLTGMLGNDTIVGGTGGDNMYGDDYFAIDGTVGAGKDVMDGGTGADYIVGCGGADTLTGGADADWFAYYKKSDSGPTAATRDVVTDFTAGDLLYLVNMDANDLVAGNQTFSLTAMSGYGAFTGSAGQLRFQGSAAGTLVLGDTNGDKIADFSVLLQGTGFLAAGSVTL